MKTAILSSLAAAAGLLVQQAAGLAVPVDDSVTHRSAPSVNGTFNTHELASGPRQYYILWFSPGVQITNFVSTMTIPKLSSDIAAGVSNNPNE